MDRFTDSFYLLFNPKALNNAKVNNGRSSDSFLLRNLPGFFMSQWHFHRRHFFIYEEETYSYGDSSGFSLDSLLIPSGDNAISETDVGGKVRN